MPGSYAALFHKVSLIPAPGVTVFYSDTTDRKGHLTNTVKRPPFLCLLKPEVESEQEIFLGAFQGSSCISNITFTVLVANISYSALSGTLHPQELVLGTELLCNSKRSQSRRPHKATSSGRGSLLSAVGTVTNGASAVVHPADGW